MEKRNAVYQNAKHKHPERWAKNTRNWDLPLCVILNPNKKNNGRKKDDLNIGNEHLST
jgi:putative transposase